MTIRATSTQDRELRFIRALLYGDSKIGKTTSLKELPEDITLIIALERGLIPLRNKNFRVVCVNSWAELTELGVALAKAQKADDGSMSIDIGGDVIAGVRIIAIDSLTECNTLCKRHIVEVDKKSLVEIREEQSNKYKAPAVYEEQFQQEDWGALASRMAKFISFMCHLPSHVIFTSLAMVYENKKTMETRCTPALNGQLALACPAYFDTVLHMESQPTEDGGTVRMWRVENDGYYVCGDASGVLNEFEPASWNSLFAKILAQPKPTEQEGR